MSEQLNQAYSLIKEGQTQAAIDVLEPLIRSDRDNEDAWWLLANAASDPEAKRNALNNVLRLSNNETRNLKAQSMLKQLDADPFDFDVEPIKKRGMSSYQELDELPQKKSRGLSCGTIVLILVGLVGVCACAAGIGIYAVAGDIFSFVSAPSEYIDYGSIENGETYSGEITLDNPTAGYLYSGNEGEQIAITVDSDGETAPFIIVYDVKAGILVGISQTQAYVDTASVVMTIPETGHYLVTMRGVSIMGTEIGFGEYDMEFEVQ